MNPDDNLIAKIKENFIQFVSGKFEDDVTLIAVKSAK